MSCRPHLLLFIFLIAFGGQVSLQAEQPAWIWRAQQDRPSPAGERGYLRKKFSIIGKVEQATLQIACAGSMEVKLNGKVVGKSAELRQPISQDVTALLQGGDNILSVHGRTTADHIGIIAQLDIAQEYDKQQRILTDTGWKFSLDNPQGWEGVSYDDTAWSPVVSLGKLGDAPWGQVFASKSPQATPAADLIVPEGFKIELIKSAESREGSWVCMTKDPQGRLYISPQNAIPESGFSKENTWGGLWRATLDTAGEISAWEKVPVPIGGCMGMGWAFDSLYLSGQGPEGQAIYRCKDTNGDGMVDAWTLFKKVPGGHGEHGAHAIREGPDGKLYFLMGNSTPLVSDIAPDSPVQNYAEDDLLPRIKDPVATFFDNVKTPYGHVLQTDADGKSWRLWCMGMRNAYDFDFDPAGNLYTYDSDMEWDVGLPWYRPTRILHLVAGGDYGFKEGAAKLPETAPDTMPPVVNIGLGSPTGVIFGAASNWPEPWRSSFLVMDWTYGRIIAVKPDRTFTDFVKGKGLPVTDLEFANDGSLYFTVGGRGTQGGLYRVTSLNAPAKTKQLPKSFPVTPKQRLAPTTSLAEARAWLELPLPDRNEITLRKIELALARYPELKRNEQAKQLGAALLATWMLGKNTAFSDHRSYAQLLVALAEPKAVAVILEHLESAESAWLKAQKPLSDPLQLGPQEKQIWFARVLCEAPSAHFTADQRKRYFRWFDEIAPQLKGGNNFSQFIEAIRKRAVAQWPKTEQDAIEKTHQLALLKLKDQQPTLANAPVRNFVKSYQMTDLENELGRVKAGRHFARGEEIYTSQLCGKCHLMNGSGGNVGPNLSAVGGRFTAKDMLEAMIDPSKVISEQYAAAIVETKTEMHMGLIAGETEQELTLFADPYGETKKTLPKSSITKREAAKISLMPAGLLNSLQIDEILDLLAYLQSGGKADAPNFKATP